MTIFKVVLGSVSLIGAGGIGLFGANEATKKTISDGLGKRKVPKTRNRNISEVIWNNILNKLTDISEKKISPQTDNFMNFDTTQWGDSYLPEELEKLCQRVSQETYSTIFKTNQKLMDDVKTFCTINIETVFPLLGKKLLKASEKNREESKETFKEKLKSLKSSNENLVDSLKEVKKFVSKKEEDQENDWKKLADWCDESYKLFFFNEEDPLWVQVEKYCKEPYREEI